MNNPDAPVTKEEFMRIHNIGDPATLARLIAEHEGDKEFDHSGCFQPHRDRNGEYIDCDGRPL
ncbi:hypothetical protein ACFYOY_13515 [Streptomyces sp. NPDC007875]|uniref:hypothetical protein n=1 Tax=Streptomyces sp. NPDC007875 TaxID=3364783 RepID=UPI0036B3A71F